MYNCMTEQFFQIGLETFPSLILFLHSLICSSSYCSATFDPSKDQHLPLHCFCVTIEGFFCLGMCNLADQFRTQTGTPRRMNK